MEPSDYWRNVCAPKVLAKKDELGRGVSNTSIAAAVEKDSGKNTTRQLVEAWFKGEREPYISQFMALCTTLGIDPVDVLKKDRATAARTPLFRARDGQIQPASEKKLLRRTRG